MLPMTTLAQDTTAPQAPASADDLATPTPGATIEIDPSASEAIRIESGEEVVEEPEVQGAVGDALENVVPESGIESVDGAVNTLTDAVGGLVDGFIGMLPQLVIALLVIIVTAFLVRLADKVATKLMRRARLRESLRDLGRIAVRVIAWFAGLMVAAGIVFPGFGFAQLIATAGLASIAIGFAFQDIFENFFAGILILWRFPFENGDFIEVDGLMGRVEDVEIRMTRLRKTNGELVLVPNATIFKNKVTVMTNKPHRRLELAVGIAYGEDVAAGRQVILDAVKSCDTVRGDAPPEVLATAFGASSIDFDVIWWADNTPIDERRSRDQVVEAIKSALDAAGIEIPYPYRTLTFSKNEPAIIEAIAGRVGSGGETGDADAS
ncbi:MAG: mechanosensitive ion channel family protein [Phycisphaerales bacterium JB063]